MEQESKQEGATEEQVVEETPAPVPTVVSTEAKETSEKTRTEKEFTSMQSMKDKSDARATKAEATVNSVQNELQEFRNEMERQRKDSRQKEIDSLADDPDAQSRLRRLHQREDSMKTAETKLEEKATKLSAKWNDAFDLARQYGVDVNELIVTDSPEVMEKMAKLLAQNKVVEQAKDEPKPQDSGFKPDSNISDAAPSDFKQLEKNFIADPYKYGKQYKEALAKRGQ